MPTLILSPRFTEDSQRLWRAAQDLGWSVERLATWRIPPEFKSIADPVLYVEGLFAPTLAQELGIRLAEPPEDWLPRLPQEYRKRAIFRTTLGEARRTLAAPAFVKPPNDKSFPAKVYRGEELPTGYDEGMSVLVSEVVSWEVEYRCFVLDRQVRTLSVYLRSGELQREAGFAATDGELRDAAAFAGKVAADPRVDLPRVCVLDVGVLAGAGWAVVEQNAAWGAGIYGCDPAAVLEVIRHAATRLA